MCLNTSMQDSGVGYGLLWLFEQCYFVTLIIIIIIILFEQARSKLEKGREYHSDWRP